MTAGARIDDGNRRRTQRLVHNILGGLVGRVFTLAAPFFVMPVMLRYLGDVHFGIWMTAVAMTSVAQFSDLGIGNGLLTRLSAAFGRDDDASARNDIASAYATLATVALILAVVTGAALLVISARHTPIHGIAIEPVSLAIVAGAVGTALAIVSPSIIGVLSIFYTLLGVSLFVPILAGLYLRRANTQIEHPADDKLTNKLLLQAGFRARRTLTVMKLTLT